MRYDPGCLEVKRRKTVRLRNNKRQNKAKPISQNQPKGSIRMEQGAEFDSRSSYGSV